MAQRTLRLGYASIALCIQEAAEMPHSVVRSRLQQAVQDAHKGTGTYAYMVDHTGDGETGNCIYQADGETRSAPYEIQDGDGTASTNLDISKAHKVIPTVSYPPQADDDDHYARMEEAFVSTNIYTDLPLYERFISKAERDSIADEDFAGKNRSYPIKKQADVDAAFHALGRAARTTTRVKTIRANIIKIAKRKGFTLPQSAQESAQAPPAVTSQSVPLKEALTPIELTETTALVW